MAQATVTLWPSRCMCCWSAWACRSVCTSSGEPVICASRSQIDSYFMADARERNGRISPCRIGSQARRGISTTRGSDKNAFRYRPTALGVGASGVPRLISRMAVRGAWPCW
ncbi:hypothetical protein D3C81_1402350 [compost metagenome]